MNPIDHLDRMITYAADHRAQLLKEAETDRLIQHARGQTGASSAERMLQGVGELLIATGQWLKGLGQPPAPPMA